MIKFVPLDVVQNHVSGIVKQTVSPDQINSWALQCYNRTRALGTLETVVEPIDIVNHKAFLPKDVILIEDVVWAEGSLNFYNEFLQTQELPTEKILIYQQFLYSELPARYATARVFYRGQQRSQLIVNHLYCNGCAIGFTLDKQMSCMTIDIVSGCVYLVYQRKTRDGDEILIPDMSSLHAGLGAYVEAMFWKDRSYSHEQNAMNLYQEALVRAENFLKSYEGEMVARKVDVEAQRQFVFSRNKFDI